MIIDADGAIIVRIGREPKCGKEDDWCQLGDNVSDLVGFSYAESEYSYGVDEAAGSLTDTGTGAANLSTSTSTSTSRIYHEDGWLLILHRDRTLLRSRMHEETE